MSGKGVDAIPIRWPAKYDPAFFDRLFREVLALADVRNAVEGAGVTITSSPDGPATISAAADVEELLASSLLTADPSNLDNARTLIGEPGILELVDQGPGSTATLRVEELGIPMRKLASIDGLSVLGGPLAGPSQVRVIESSADDTVVRRVDDGTGNSTSVVDFGQLTVGMAPDGLWTHEKIEDSAALSVLGRAENSAGVVADIEASSNNQVFRRVGDVLDFGQLTAAMAPDALWTYAKLQDVSETSRVLGRATAGSGSMEELTLSQVLDFIGSAAEGDILYRGASGWERLPAGTDGQVLTLASGVPTWADPDSLLQSSFVTSDDDTGTLANSRQLLGGTGIALDDSTPGQLTVEEDP